MRIFICITLLFLSACANPSAESQSCPTPKKWTPEEQQKILVEEKKLPADSILIPVLMECSSLRSQLKPKATP